MAEKENLQAPKKIIRDFIAQRLFSGDLTKSDITDEFIGAMKEVVQFERSLCKAMVQEFDKAAEKEDKKAEYLAGEDYDTFDEETSAVMGSVGLKTEALHLSTRDLTLSILEHLLDQSSEKGSQIVADFFNRCEADDKAVLVKNLGL